MAEKYPRRVCKGGGWFRSFGSYDSLSPRDDKFTLETQNKHTSLLCWSKMLPLLGTRHLDMVASELFILPQQQHITHYLINRLSCDWPPTNNSFPNSLFHNILYTVLLWKNTELGNKRNAYLHDFVMWINHPIICIRQPFFRHNGLLIKSFPQSWSNYRITKSNWSNKW